MILPPVDRAQYVSAGIPSQRIPVFEPELFDHQVLVYLFEILCPIPCNSV